MSDKAHLLRERRAEAGRERVRDRRRFKVGSAASGEASGEASVTVGPEATGTIFPGALRKPVEGPVLKDGALSVKVGGDVLVGWLKGARIVTLALEERATCPRSCDLWRRCYGNAMPFQHRYRHGPETEIGRAVEFVRVSFDMRWSVRHSGTCGRWGSFTIDWPTERKILGDAIVCPEQLAANAGPSNRHCGNCGACWSTDAAIVFIEH